MILFKLSSESKKDDVSVTASSKLSTSFFEQGYFTSIKRFSSWHEHLTIPSGDAPRKEFFLEVQPTFRGSKVFMSLMGFKFHISKNCVSSLSMPHFNDGIFVSHTLDNLQMFLINYTDGKFISVCKTYTPDAVIRPA